MDLNDTISDLTEDGEILPPLDAGLPEPDDGGSVLPRMFSATAVANWLNVSETMLADMRARGTGPRFVIVGAHQIRYPETELLDWLHRAKVDVAVRHGRDEKKRPNKTPAAEPRSVGAQPKETTK